MKQRVLAILGILALALLGVLVAVRATQAAATAVAPNLSVVKSFNIGMPPTLNDQKEFVAGEPLEMQISVTNNEASPVNLLVFDAMTPNSPGAAELLVDRLQFQSTGAPTTAIDASTAGSIPDAYVGAMVLELQPGESWVARVAVRVRVAAPGAELSGAPVVYAELASPIQGSCQPNRSPQCRYAGWSPSAEDVANLIEVLEPLPGNPVAAAFVTPDLGDAPDSTNHFAAAMTAYPGIPADFPSVYDPATGAPSGPYHLHARPLRLGLLASRERDADLNPNRNLVPPADTANLDTRDDGLDPALLAFSDCATSTVAVEITVEQWAIDYLNEQGHPAYLNMWVDGSRDGSWNDGKSCGNATAVEHIIINAPVDVAALGPGTHTLTFTTERVPWPANQADRPAWLRVSLSDDKAPTPLNMGGVTYGDGRGPVARYFLGETEDYLWRSEDTPPDQLEGADLALRVDGRLDIRDIPPIEIQLNATQMLTHTSAVFLETVTLMNRGDTPATGTQLIIMPDPSLRQNGASFEVSTDPPLPPDIVKTTCHGSDADCRIVLDLGTIPPSGQPLNVAVSTEVLCDPMSGGFCSASNVSARAMVVSDNDANPQNDSDEKTWDLPRPVDSLLPPSITRPGNGTTNSGQVQLAGLARPMATINLYVDRFGGNPDAQTMADGNGRWQTSVNLEQGPHQIVAAYPGSQDHSKPANIIVRPGLPTDPLGFILEINGYTTQPWGRNGRVDERGWALPLLPDASYRMHVPFDCTAANAGVNLIQPGKNVATFGDPDNDDVYTAEFKTGDLDPEELAALRFTCGNQQINLPGELRNSAITGTVTDAETGAPVAGAAVVMWESYTATDDLWKFRRDPLVNGQGNPRFTDSAGSAAFFLPEGIYAFSILADGYQSYQTPPVRASRCLTCIDARLVPTQLGATTMALTGDGFNPPAVTLNAGESLEWVNVDAAGRGIEATAASANALQAAAEPVWASGLLQTGARFTASFNQPGTYTLVDPLDPQTRATVIVEPGGPGQVFLPAVIRP